MTFQHLVTTRVLIGSHSSHSLMNIKINRKSLACNEITILKHLSYEFTILRLTSNTIGVLECSYLVLSLLIHNHSNEALTMTPTSY